MPQTSVPQARIVVSIGGNAFERAGQPLTMASQFALAETMLGALLPVLTGPDAVLLTHGNGPQVGNLLRRSDVASGLAYPVPLEVCVAESEGELGYVLMQAAYNVLAKAHCTLGVAALLTLVEVDAADPAFATPTKPIGAVLTPAEVDALRARGVPMALDARRGWRRVVASPRPLRVPGIATLDALLRNDTLVIASGGGGVPVARTRDGGTERLDGIAAVVDKDHTAALLADALGAHLMLIVTAVPCVYRDYADPLRRTPLRTLRVAEAEALARAGQFPAGTMGPKIDAALHFLRGGPGRRVIVCAPEGIAAALAGAAGGTGTAETAGTLIEQ